MRRILWAFFLSSLAMVSSASEVLRKLNTETSPRAFLDELCERPDGVYAIDEPVTDWVKENDIAELIELIDSDLPCSSVALTASSRIRWNSTLGDEAGFLIQGFRQGEYPPALTSEQLSASDRTALRYWWERRRNFETRENHKQK